MPGPVRDNAVFEGEVVHHRLLPRPHKLVHRVSLWRIDIDAADAGQAGPICRTWPGIVRLRRCDFLPDSPGETLRDAVEHQVSASGASLELGPIHLLANLRTFGHCFNPAAFFFCLTPDEQAIQAVVVEVTNTPWKERHVYVLAEPSPAASIRGAMGKRHHVSPFINMHQDYEWFAWIRGDRLAVGFTVVPPDGVAVLRTSVSLRRRVSKEQGFTCEALRRPFPSFRTLALIYGHAVVLRAKGVRTVPHPLAGRREARR